MSTMVLTPRELDVLRLLCQGTTRNRDIALELTMSEHTVHWYVNELLGKLEAKTRAELVVRAYSSGLLGGPA